MAHNPIVAQRNVGIFDLNFVVELNRFGVLYQGQRCVAILGPGQRPPLDLRLNLSAMTVYMVDAAPHDLDWQVSLPARSRDHFAATVSLNYRVADPQRMVEGQVRDTEALVMRTVEPELTRISRSFGLNEYERAEIALNDRLRVLAPLASQYALNTASGEPNLRMLCGLESLTWPYLHIILDNEVHDRIDEIKKQIRATSGVQSVDETFEVPTREPADKFQVNVHVIYRVHRIEDLPSESLEEAKQQLWPLIRSALRRGSRQYMVDQLTEADARMQDNVDQLVDERVLEKSGLHIETIDVSTDLTEKTRERYVERMQELHHVELKRIQEAGAQENSRMIQEAINKGNWAVLALAASKGEITTAEVFEKITAVQAEKFKQQMVLFEKFSEVQGIDIDALHKRSADLTGDMIQNTTGQTQPNLMPGAEVPKLQDTSKDSDDQSKSVGEQELWWQDNKSKPCK